MRPLLSCAALCLLAVPAAAQQKTVPRYFEFRDGSILRLEVVDEPRTLTVVRGSGRIESLTVPLSRLGTVMLTPEQDFARKKAVLSAVRQLGADDFRRREQAYARLHKLGAAVRPDLETCLQLTTDAETQARLRALLAGLPAPAKGGKAAAAFDRLQLGGLLWGYLGDQGIPVLVGGSVYRLGRKDVHAMRADPPRTLGPTPNAVPEGFSRIGENDFPPGCVEEGFERTPQGRPLQVGENIEKLFISKGFVLSTSIASSYVSVNTYMVQGKSRGLSAATHQPLWEGEITIRFVEPGHEDIPSGVTHFGCYIAAVVPGGTSLVAYDLQGNELGHIDTQRHNTDFLGVRSSVPIHRIRIVPHPELDRDYTLDDFIFLPVRPSEFTRPDRCTVLTAGGERVLCKDVTLGRGEARLHGLPGGLPDRTCKLSELRRLNAPRPARPAVKAPAAGVFVELRDGSVIFGGPSPGQPGMPLFARRPQALKERDNLAGLWGSRYRRLAHAPQGGQAAVWDEDERRWQPASYVRFLEEVVLWKGPGDEFEARGYRKLPPLWLAAPAKGPVAGSWHLRTVQGEDLVLADPEALAGTLSQGVSALWQGQPIRIPAAEVVSIYQARAKQ
jgi:hypothetical protein